MRIAPYLVLTAAAVGLSACGGGSAGNTSPTLSSLGDTRIAQDSVAAPVSFTVGDRETPAGELLVSVRSSDETLLPGPGLVLGGSGASRSLAVTPAEAAMGSAMLTISVRDGAGAETTRQVQVEVEGTATDFSALANGAFVLPEDGEPRAVRGLDIRPDVDDDELAFNALIQ